MAATPENDCMVSIRQVGTGKTFTVYYPREATVMDLKREITKQIEIPGAQQCLLMGGTELKNDKKVSEYNLQTLTVVMLVLRAVATPPTTPIELYERKPYTPLSIIDMIDIPIPSLGTHQDFYVWCQNTQHLPLYPGVADPPLPEQLQKANLKIRCQNCKNDSVKNRSPPIETWTDLLRSIDDPPVGKCYLCDVKSTPLEYYFLCRGERATPSPDGRTVCRGSELTKTMFLPCLVTNTNETVSDDSYEADPIQIEFFPCKHRMNATGLDEYLRSCHSRKCLVQNTHVPDILGQFGLHCIRPGCDSVLCVPTCRVAGSESYNRIKNWQAKEAVLAEGGTLCPKCSTAFIVSPSDLAHPRRVCPNKECQVVFCEQHEMLWDDCPHNETPDKRLIRLIRDAFVEGSIRRCPKEDCLFGGQKDGACTHILCPLCKSKYCYWCGGFLRDGWCPRKCPWYLEDTPLTASPTCAEEVAKFHRLRTVRLLRNIRTENPAQFDPVFNSIPPQERTITINQEDEDDGCVSLIVTLDDVKAPPPTIPLYLASEPLSEEITLTDYP